MKRLINTNKKKNNNNIVDNNKIISKKVKTIWNNCILPKWDIYSPYLLFRQIEITNSFSELTFPGKESSKTFDEFYSQKKFGDCLIEIEKYQKKGVLNYNEFIYFCQFGLPSFYRQRLWPLLFNNNCQITFELFLILKGKTTNINSLFDKGTLNITPKDTSITDNDTVNQLIKDILEIKYLFNHVIINKKLSQKNIILQVYFICLCLFLYRIDIPYNKNMIYIIYTLLIRKLSEKETFIIVANLIFSNCLIEKFFNEKFEEHMPYLHNHFKKLGITSDLYLYDWFESLFTQFFNFKLSGIIIDLYIIDGEYILIQTALTILKLYEDVLLNSSVIDIFRILKKSPKLLDFVEFNTAFQTFGNLKQPSFLMKRIQQRNSNCLIKLKDIYDQYKKVLINLKKEKENNFMICENNSGDNIEDSNSTYSGSNHHHNDEGNNLNLNVEENNSFYDYFIKIGNNQVNEFNHKNLKKKKKKRLVNDMKQNSFIYKIYELVSVFAPMQDSFLNMLHLISDEYFIEQNFQKNIFFFSEKIFNMNDSDIELILEKIVEINNYYQNEIKYIMIENEIAIEIELIYLTDFIEPKISVFKNDIEDYKLNLNEQIKFAKKNSINKLESLRKEYNLTKNDMVNLLFIIVFWVPGYDICISDIKNEELSYELLEKQNKCRYINLDNKLYRKYRIRTKKEFINNMVKEKGLDMIKSFYYENIKCISLYNFYTDFSCE